MIPGIPPKVVMPPGQQKKMVPGKPIQPQIMPLGPQKIIPPKTVAPRGFRSRPQQGGNQVLRARKGDICPDCLKKQKAVLCPDCSREEEEKKKAYQNKANKSQYSNKANESKAFNEAKSSNDSKQYQRKDFTNNLKGKKETGKYSSKTFQKKGDFDKDLDNYKYHEINETTENNLKSIFIVKKEGVIISTNKDL